MQLPLPNKRACPSGAGSKGVPAPGTHGHRNMAGGGYAYASAPTPGPAHHSLPSAWQQGVARQFRRWCHSRPRQRAPQAPAPAPISTGTCGAHDLAGGDRAPGRVATQGFDWGTARSREPANRDPPGAAPIPYPTPAALASGAGPSPYIDRNAARDMAGGARTPGPYTRSRPELEGPHHLRRYRVTRPDSARLHGGVPKRQARVVGRAGTTGMGADRQLWAPAVVLASH